LYVVDPKQFEKHVDLFLQLRKAEGLQPEETFDDGHISNFEFAAPILHSRGLAARFFITVGWTGNRPNYMGWPELRSLHDSGQSIGAHGWTHTLLTHCGERELFTELNSARLTLEDKLGTSITTMSLPGGRYNARVLEACRSAGYTQIFSSIPRAEPTPIGVLVGRLNIRGDMSLERISELFEPKSTVLEGLGRRYRMKEAAKAALGDTLYEKLWKLLNRSEPDSDDGGGNAE
jgi:hypothetical protein